MGRYPGYQPTTSGPARRRGTAPSTQPRPAGRGRTLLIASIAALAILGFATVAAVQTTPLGGEVYALREGDAVRTTTDALCKDLQTQDYAAAYRLLASGYAQKVTPDQFSQVGKLQDQIDGPVKSCGLSGGASSVHFDPATNTATLVARSQRNAVFIGTLSLAKQDGAWRIASIDQSLQGRDVGPLLVASHFCAALVAGNYAAAYGDFSTKHKALLTQAAYVANITQVLAQAQDKFVGCQPTLASYALSPDDATATLNSALMVQLGQQTYPVLQKISFVKEAGGWHIDTIAQA